MKPPLPPPTAKAIPRLRSSIARTCHEYIAGEIFAMATAPQSATTSLLGNLFAGLRTHSKALCRALIWKASNPAAQEPKRFYPDVIVTCEDRLQELDSGNKSSKLPLVVIEIPPTTEAHRLLATNSSAYRTLPSLAEYLPPARNKPAGQLPRRGDIGWDIITYEPGDTVEIASLENQARYGRDSLLNPASPPSGLISASDYRWTGRQHHRVRRHLPPLKPNRGTR